VHDPWADVEEEDSVRGGRLAAEGDRILHAEKQEAVVTEIPSCMTNITHARTCKTLMSVPTAAARPLESPAR
jgi:hypothetical protein